LYLIIRNIKIARHIKIDGIAMKRARLLLFEDAEPGDEGSTGFGSSVSD